MEITVTRSYVVMINEETVERYSGSSDMEELLKQGCQVATRMVDVGDLSGSLYLIDGDELYWTDEPDTDDEIIDEITFDAREIRSEVTGA